MSKREHITQQVTPPSIYTDLNYIETNGTQYIITPVYTAGDIYEAGINLIFTVRPYHVNVISAASPPTEDDVNWTGGLYSPNPGVVRVWCGSSANILGFSNLNTGIQYFMSVKVNRLTHTVYQTCNNTTYNRSYSGTARGDVTTAFLGGLYKNNVSRYLASAKAISAYIKINDVLVRNYVPKYNTLTNKAGFFDLVTNSEFLTSAGTSDFLYG